MVEIDETGKVHGLPEEWLECPDLMPEIGGQNCSKHGRVKSITFYAESGHISIEICLRCMKEILEAVDHHP